MKKILIVIVLFFVLLPVLVNAATYYVDASGGSDSYNGQYPTFQGGSDGPWQTWDKVRGGTYSAGDIIKFKRGETFDVSSTWWFSHSGSAGNYIVIEDYGSGNKPVWDAVDDVVGVAGDWTEETGIGSNIWSRSLSGSSKRTFVGDYESAEASAAANIDGSTYLWYHDGNRLYVYSTQNPADEYASIKVMTLSTLFAFNGVSYVKLQNIRLQGGRTITINGDCSYLDILYNDIWYWGEFAIFAFVGGGSGNAQDYINVEYNDINAKRNLIDKSITEMENRGLEDCIRMYNAQNNWNIRHNTFNDGGHALILMYNQAMTESGIHNNLIEYNEFYGQNSTYVRAWGIQGGEGGVTNNIFRYNWIEKVNVRSQLGGNNNEYYYNIFYDTQQSPVTTKSDISQAVNFPGFGSTVSHDNKFYNNVIYKAYNPGIWFVDSGNDPYNTEVKNNIVMETGEGGNHPNIGLLYDSSIVTTQTIENNCFYDTDRSDVISHKGTTYTITEANSGLSEYSNNFFQDPFFVDAINGNFNLQSLSPCIDNGTDVGLTQDFEGNIVPQGSAPDIGAYEFESVGETPVCEPNTYYVDATNGDDGNDGMCTTTAWQTISKVNGETFFPGDNILFKRGEIWREPLTVPSSGSAGNPITFGAYGSDGKPIVSGADLINSWSNEGGNVWSASVSIEPKIVIFDGTLGNKESALGNVDAAYEWYWASNILYVYSTSDPDTAYTNPGIEASQRNNCIYALGKDYITIDGIECYGWNNYGGIQFANCGGVTVKNCTVNKGGGEAIKCSANNVDKSNINITGNTCTGTGTNNKDGIRVTEMNAGNFVNVTISDNVVSYFEWRGIMLFGVGVSDRSSGPHTVSGNEVSYCGDGFYLGYANNVMISNNTLHHNNDMGGSGEWYGIGFLEGDNCIIEYNHLYSNAGEGIEMSSDMGGSGTNNNILRYNSIHDNNRDGGIKISNAMGSGQNKIYHNLIYGHSASGDAALFIRDPGHEIYNNVLYENYNGLFIYGDNGDNIKFKNNVVAGTNAGGYHVRVPSGLTGLDINYNLYDDDIGTKFRWEGTDYNFANWKTQSGQGANSPTPADPLFVDALNRNFSLQSDSPCRDAGTDVGLTLDYEGNLVPQGSAPDIGAYEYEGGAGCISGDINCDSSIDIYDLVVIGVNFGLTSGFNVIADTDNNSIIDVSDLVFVASRFT